MVASSATICCDNDGSVTLSRNGRVIINTIGL